MLSDDPFEPSPGQPPDAADWMEVRVVGPPELGMAVMAVLREQFDFRDADWCVLERRQDYARVDFDPCPARTDSEYTDWPRNTPSS